MTKRVILIAILIACFGNKTNAQVDVHFNIGVQPVWGPTGYDYARYYYMPDMDAYYDVAARVYMFNEGGRWIERRELPPMYRNFDLYHGYKVVINDPNPWMHHDRYRKQYYQFRGRHDQEVIRDSRDHRYWENPGHPHHNEWHGGERHDEHGHGERHEEHRHDEHHDGERHDR